MSDPELGAHKYFQIQDGKSENSSLITTTKVGVLKLKPGTPEFQSPT